MSCYDTVARVLAAEDPAGPAGPVSRGGRQASDAFRCDDAAGRPPWSSVRVGLGARGGRVVGVLVPFPAEGGAVDPTCAAGCVH